MLTREEGRKFMEAEARGRKGLSMPRPPTAPRKTVSRSREYYDALFANCCPMWESGDEDGVRLRANEERASADDRDWSRRNDAYTGPLCR